MLEYDVTVFTDLIKKLEIIKNEVRISLIANVRDLSTAVDDNIELLTEFFSENEMEEIINALRNFGLYTDVFFDENKFMKRVIDKQYSLLEKKYDIVYNWSKRGTGPGRKALIPAFCNLNNIKTTSSDPYVVSLCRHKYHYNCILDKIGLPVHKSWILSEKHGWLLGKKPYEGQKIIIKLTYESASIGLNSNSVTLVDETLDRHLSMLCKKYSQPITVQEYIEGYEIEVPVFNINNNPFAIAPIGISIEDDQYFSQKILTYETTYNDNYSFYLFDKFSKSNIENILHCAENVAKSIGISGFGRVDFRVKKNGDFFITDIATNPYTTKHSSFAFLFNLIGLTFEELQATLIGIVCSQNGWII